MDVTLFEVHLDDVALRTSGRTGRASTDAESIAASGSDGSDEGLPRAVLALVPVFVGLGVAAGFLAARRFGAGESGGTDEPAAVGIEPELR